MTEQRFRVGFAPGSYCLAVCYCGQHEGYQPTRPTVITATKADTRQAHSWADREEPTWLDR